MQFSGPTDRVVHRVGPIACRTAITKTSIWRQEGQYGQV